MGSRQWCVWTLTGATEPAIVNVYTNGSVATNELITPAVMFLEFSFRDNFFIYTFN